VEELPVTWAQFHEAAAKRLWLRHFDEYSTIRLSLVEKVPHRQTLQEFTI
jgi:hypothetical protein